MLNVLKPRSRKLLGAALCATAAPLMLLGATNAQATGVVTTKNIKALVHALPNNIDGLTGACLDVTVSSSDGSRLSHWSTGVYAPLSGTIWDNANGKASVGDHIQIYEFQYSNGSMCQGKIIAEGDLQVPADSLQNAWVTLR
jgi:hypothetical protein